MALPGMNKEQSKRLRDMQFEYNRRKIKVIEKKEKLQTAKQLTKPQGIP